MSCLKGVIFRQQKHVGSQGQLFWLLHQAVGGKGKIAGLPEALTRSF